MAENEIPQAEPEEVPADPGTPSEEVADEVLEGEFEQMAEDFIIEDGGEHVTEAPDEEPTAEEPPATEEPPAPESVEEPEPEPEPEPEAPEEEPEKEVVEEPQKEPEPQVNQEELQAKRQAFQHRLEGRYAIPEGMVEKLADNPEEVLPTLLAGVHMDILENVSKLVDTQLARRVPTMVETHQVEAQTAAKNEDAFFTAWPKLNNAKGKAEVEKIGAVYRQLYPDASAEDFVQNVGPQAMMALKIPLVEDTPAPAPTPPPPAPLGAHGSAPISAPAPASPNEFTVLADEYLVEDM